MSTLAPDLKSILSTAMTRSRELARGACNTGLPNLRCYFCSISNGLCSQRIFNLEVPRFPSSRKNSCPSSMSRYSQVLQPKLSVRDTRSSLSLPHSIHTWHCKCSNRSIRFIAYILIPHVQATHRSSIVLYLLRLTASTHT